MHSCNSRIKVLFAAQQSYKNCTLQADFINFICFLYYELSVAKYLKIIVPAHLIKLRRMRRQASQTFFEASKLKRKLAVIAILKSLFKQLKEETSSVRTKTFVSDLTATMQNLLAHFLI